MPPSVTVAVPSHERPVRLGRLLDALAEQTLEEEWEVVVVHDSGDDTEAVLSGHPLRAAGRLRHVRLDRGTGSASRQRNVAWREANAPLVAFTDDDCRPAPGWLDALLVAARADPGAFVQGRTVPDQLDGVTPGGPGVRTLHVAPPTPHVPTCNVLYPRALIERVGGFSEDPDLRAGEDTELAWRVVEAGGRQAAAPAAVVHHAVEAVGVLGAVRAAVRWGDLAYVVRRHPHLRSELIGGVFWKAEHGLLAAAAAGLALAPRRRGALVLALPYLWARRGRDLPGWAALDVAEMAALARGSIRHRTLML